MTYETGTEELLKQNQRLWDFRLHAENIFNARINFFLVSQSFLVAALIGLLKIAEDSSLVNFAYHLVIMGGLILSIVFVYTGYNLFERIGSLKLATKELSHRLDQLLDEHEMLIPSNFLLGVLVPGLFCMGWVLIALY